MKKKLLCFPLLLILALLSACGDEPERVQIIAMDTVMTAATSIGNKSESFTFAALPESLAEMQALPEGQRKMKRIEGHGMEPLLVADEKESRKGDMLWYRGDWYECVSSMLYDHTDER